MKRTGAPEGGASGGLGEQAVSESVAQIERRILELAQEHGIRFTFPLQELPQWKADEGFIDGTLRIFGEMYAERVTVDRRKGRYGLWYRAIGGPGGSPEVLLRDAPLIARQRFLTRASDFAKEFKGEVDKMRRLREEAEEEAKAIRRQASDALKVLE